EPGAAEPGQAPQFAELPGADGRDPGDAGAGGKVAARAAAQPAKERSRDKRGLISAHSRQPIPSAKNAERMGTRKEHARMGAHTGRARCTAVGMTNFAKGSFNLDQWGDLNEVKL